nr:neuronal acetylcholine receptor subunit beta-3-like [Penaeus vannamei]
MNFLSLYIYGYSFAISLGKKGKFSPIQVKNLVLLPKSFSIEMMPLIMEKIKLHQMSQLWGIGREATCYLVHNSHGMYVHATQQEGVKSEILLRSGVRSGMDTRDQTMYLNTEMIMEWHDHYLEWDPDMYNGTSVIRVPYHEIWYPDVILYNTADPNYRRSILRTNAIVKSTGQVRLLTHAMLLSSCDIDTTWYPFDQQDCTLYLSSWTYDSSKIELFDGAADLSEFSENPEFLLENFYSVKRNHKDPCCNLPFSCLSQSS